MLNPQQHLAPHWGLGERPGDLRRFLADRLEVARRDVLGWDLMAYDLTPARRIGLDRALIASARLDNQATCYAGVRALIAQPAPDEPGPRQLLALFDHEEVGSVSERGAQSTLLADHRRADRAGRRRRPGGPAAGAGRHRHRLRRHGARHPSELPREPRAATTASR